MAAETYTIKKQVDTITNTKDTSQAAWPRWTPSFSAWVQQTIHEYNEWSDAIWGPGTTNVVEYTYDDLVKKY